MLTWLRDLFGLTLIEKNLAWYLVHGRLSTQRAHAVTSYMNRLLLRLRPHALDLVDAFGLGARARARADRDRCRGGSPGRGARVRTHPARHRP